MSDEEDRELTGRVDGSTPHERQREKRNKDRARTGTMVHRLDEMVTALVGKLPDFLDPYLARARIDSTTLKHDSPEDDDLARPAVNEKRDSRVKDGPGGLLQGPIKSLLNRSGMHRLQDRFRASDTIGEFFLTLLEELFFDGEGSFRPASTMETEIRVLRKRCEALREVIETKDERIHEIHRRVTSNFREMLSLLRLKEKKSDDSTEEILDQALLLLSNVLSIHETPRTLKDFDRERLDLKPYLRDLTYSIVRSLTPDGIDTTVNFRVSDVSVPTDRVFPLTLIVNELITEVIRDRRNPAESGENGVLIVSLKLTVSKGSCHLKISDNNHEPAGRTIEYQALDNPDLEFLSNMIDKRLMGSIRQTENELSNGWHINFPLSDSLQKKRDSLRQSSPSFS